MATKETIYSLIIVLLLVVIGYFVFMEGRYLITGKPEGTLDKAKEVLYYGDIEELENIARTSTYGVCEAAVKILERENKFPYTDFNITYREAEYKYYGGFKQKKVLITCPTTVTKEEGAVTYIFIYIIVNEGDKEEIVKICYTASMPSSPRHCTAYIIEPKKFGIILWELKPGVGIYIE